MEDIISPINPNKCMKTYGKADKIDARQENLEAAIPQVQSFLPSKREPLTTRNAVKFLLEGSLKKKVCRYCLNVAPLLSELDQILQVADKGSLYKVTIKDMVASVHPFKIADDPNFPDKICDQCVDRTISSYLFTQQCERAERAIRNCFDDIDKKFQKLDPLERPKHKRGRQKLNPNHNVLYVEHERVIDYADPIIHIVNTAAESLVSQPRIQEFECLKCCEVLPNLMSLLNHTKTHPESMWYNCRLCGKSFPKRHLLKKHWNNAHSPENEKNYSRNENVPNYNCKRCDMVTENYYEYLQHIEKHKFKIVMEHLIDKNMNKLCAICLNKDSNMVPLDKMICLHGGCPGLTGDRPLYNVLASTLPEMNILDNYTGTRICEKCLSHAITSYVFINQTYFVRNRLSTCVSVMLENLDKITENNKNICIEIAQSAIMNVVEPFEDTLSPEDDLNESNFKVEVLEDEFRLKSEDESDTENNIPAIKQDMNTSNTEIQEDKKYYLNGFIHDKIPYYKIRQKPKKIRSVFTCPVCKKHFISDYFLKRHVMKHIPRKTECIVCKCEFKTKFDMYEHKKISHIKNKSIFLSCKVCGRCYTTENKLKYHVKLHKKQFCQLCDKVFKSEKCFNTHMQRHMRKLGTIMKKYVQNCGFCEKDCPNDNEFSLHVNKSHLQLKPYNCDMCERCFYTEYNLKCHQKVHSVYSREICHFCDKSLNSRRQLVIHVRKHIGDKPFTCQICYQSFYSQFTLRKHMKISHGGIFLCKYCKTIFVMKKQLKAHVNKVHNSLF